MSLLGKGIACLVVAGLSGCVLPPIALQETATETLSVPVRGETTLKIDSHAGSVTIVGDADGKVTVEAVKRASNLEKLASIKVELVARGEVIELNWNRDESRSEARSVELTVHAPKRLAATLKVGAGSIKIEGLEGDLTVDDGAGGIIADGGRGTVRLETGAGSIEATRLDGTLRARTGAGSIKASGTFRGESTVKTSAGSIEVAIPAASRLKVSASTSAGTFSNDFGLTASGIGGSSAAGLLGDGSQGSLTLQSSAGSVSLRKRD